MATNEQSVQAYTQVQDRMTGLLAAASPDQLARQVPACPDWTVRDLLAHVTGVAADVAAGRIEGAGSDPWTAAQVDARREHDRDALLAEWAAGRDALLDALRAIDPVLAAQVVFDVTTHEHDLRGALEQPGERDSDGVLIGWEWATRIVGQLRDAYGTGAIRLRTTDGGETVCGAGDVTAAVSAERFELWRAMTGRRSLEQVRAWAWDGEPAAEAVCLLPARATALQE
jgi:uncharacterized protein (TIGR03083 family)